MAKSRKCFKRRQDGPSENSGQLLHDTDSQALQPNLMGVQPGRQLTETRCILVPLIDPTDGIGRAAWSLVAEMPGRTSMATSIACFSASKTLNYWRE